MDFYAKQFGLLRPVRTSVKIKNPPLRYRWPDTYAALQSLSAGPGDPHDGVLLRYSNPVDGGWTLPTISCEIQLLRRGEKTRPHRHTSSTIYHVFSGAGSTVIDGQRFEWRKGDCFVVPLWSRHEHQNGSAQDEAILFSLSDRPVLESLGLYREDGEASRR